jgi:hypothetical protein
MKKIILISLICLFNTSLFAQTNVLDKVIAVVGKNMIKHSELETSFLQQKQRYGIVDDAYAEKCDILEGLLINKLMLHQAQIDSVNVTQEQVNREMDNRINYMLRQAGSREVLEKQMNKSVSEIKEYYQELIKENILISEISRKLTSDVKVTPNEVTDYYNKIPIDSLPIVEQEYEFSQIVIHPKISAEEKKLIKERLKELNEYYSKKIDEIINSIELKESDLNKLRLEIDEKINHYGKLQNLEKWEAQLNLIKIEIEEKTNNLNQIYDNTFQTINWLTDKYADFYFLIDEKNIVYPRGNYAAKCSEAQKQFAKENRHLRKKNIELEIQLKKLESYYPNIDEIIDSDINESFFDDDSINTMDKIDSLVSKHEQEHLTKQEILQKALNTYLYSRKSK